MNQLKQSGRDAELSNSMSVPLILFSNSEKLETTASSIGLGPSVLACVSGLISHYPVWFIDFFSPIGQFLQLVVVADITNITNDSLFSVGIVVPPG